MKDQLKQLEREYESVPVPAALDEIITQTTPRHLRMVKKIKWAASSIIATILFTTTLNISPAFAENIAKIPGFDKVVDVLTFQRFEINDPNHKAVIEVPHVTGDSAELQALNMRYEKKGKELYAQFKAETQKNTTGHTSITTGYETVASTEQLLVVGDYYVNNVGSSSTTMHYTTIDKQKQLIVTLPSLFKNRSYQQVISAYIKDEMRQRMIQSNGEELYWVTGTKYYKKSDGYTFEKISKKQNFYINEHHKLVICFDKYDVAPGAMGLQEFEIPTKILKPYLLTNEYIK